MDLGNFDVIKKSSNEGVDMALKNPADGSVLKHDDGTPQTIRLLGRYSDAFKAKMHQHVNDRLQQLNQRRGTNAPPTTAEKIESETLEQMVAATTGWDIKLDGVRPPEFNADNVRAFYKRFPWFLEQADDFTTTTANFTKVSTK